MPVAPSFQDLLNQGQSESQGRRPDLLHLEGDITQAQLHGAASMADAVIRFAAQAFLATFIDGAKGSELTALVDDHLNIQRDPASNAQVALALTRPSAGGSEPAGLLLAGSVVATAFDAQGDEVQFETDTNVTWLPGELGPKTVQATAVLPGRGDNNVVAGAITRIIDQPAFDGTFQVTNPAAAAGGNDEQSDEELRVEAKEFFNTLRRGTLAALEFGAKQVDSVRVAIAVEDSVTGAVTLRVTDSDGNSTLQMIADVHTELVNWKCAGPPVNVVGGSQILVDLNMTLTVCDGFDVASLATVFADAAAARIRKFRVGETMFLDSISAAVIGVASDSVKAVTFDSIVTTPGGAQAIQDYTPVSSAIVRPGVITVVGA